MLRLLHQSLPQDLVQNVVVPNTSYTSGMAIRSEAESTFPYYCIDAFWGSRLHFSALAKATLPNIISFLLLRTITIHELGSSLLLILITT